MYVYAFLFVFSFLFISGYSLPLLTSVHVYLNLSLPFIWPLTPLCISPSSELSLSALHKLFFFFFFWKKAISKMLLLMQTAPFSCDTVRMFAFYVYLCKTCKHCDIVDVFFILFGANISESRTSYQDSFTFPRQTKISYCVRSITIRWYLCVRVAYAFLSLTESGVCS